MFNLWFLVLSCLVYSVSSEHTYSTQNAVLTPLQHVEVLLITVCGHFKLVCYIRLVYPCFIMFSSALFYPKMFSRSVGTVLRMTISHSTFDLIYFLVFIAGYTQ